MLTIKSVEKLSLNSLAWDEGKGSVSGYGIRRRTGNTVVLLNMLKYRTWTVGNAGTRSAATARPGRQIWRETRRGGLLAKS